MTFTLLELAQEARRETERRKRVFPRWVEQGRIRAEDAARKIDIMEAIAGVLEEEAAKPPQEPADGRTFSDEGMDQPAAGRTSAESGGPDK